VSVWQGNATHDAGTTRPASDTESGDSPVSDTEPCNAQRSADKAACDLQRDWLHIRRANLQALRHQAARAKDIGRLRRSVALWQAGVRYDAAAKLLLEQLPDDTDWDDPAAVRAACSAVVAQVLGARAQLEEVGS
jgi:hypothetical protein